MPLRASTVTSIPVFKTSVALCERDFVPTTHGIPNSLDTMDAWQVIPPASVIIATAFFMAGTKSGDVIEVTKMSPALN